MSINFFKKIADIFFFIKNCRIFALESVNLDDGGRT